MANPNPVLPPNQATRFTATRQPKRVNLAIDARDAEQVIIARIRQDKVSNSDLALLVRALCQVLEAIRILRGVPLPGQLRPDLDPVQMARMLKRAKARQPIDLTQLSNGKFYDDPEPIKNELTKESLSKDEGVTGRPEGEGDKTDEGSL